MILSIIYLNHPVKRGMVIRQHIEKVIRHVHKRHDFKKVNIRHPQFSIFDAPLTFMDMLNVPSHLQYERIEFEDDKFRTLFQLVVDTQPLPPFKLLEMSF